MRAYRILKLFRGRIRNRMACSTMKLSFLGYKTGMTSSFFSYKEERFYSEKLVLKIAWQSTRWLTRLDRKRIF